MKLVPQAIILPLLVLTTYSATATDYQSFISIGYSKFDNALSSSDSYGFSSTYFFDKRSTLGPLNEFEYINPISNVFAGYASGDWNDSYRLGGELFINNFLIAGSYHRIDADNKKASVDNYDMSLGYLITDDFLVKVTANKVEDVNVFYQFNAAYNWQLNANDYIGFTYNTDENFDFHTFSSKYFVALAQEQYLTTSISYIFTNNGDDFWSVGANFYFNKNSSIFANYAENDIYSFGAEYYFNKNYALSVRYSSNSTDKKITDFDVYSLDFIAQF
ncbi:MAG: putative porin [Alteromonadaceae bacterium]|nr:putative porin [Alteromonadaceae bacterium]